MHEDWVFFFFCGNGFFLKSNALDLCHVQLAHHIIRLSYASSYPFRRQRHVLRNRSLIVLVDFTGWSGLETRKKDLVSHKYSENTEK